MSENIVTTDFTKEHISILPKPEANYTGPDKLILHSGEVKEYVSLVDGVYTLKSGATAKAEESFEIMLNTGLLGNNASVPHRLTSINKYYVAFTQELQSIYFEFESGNEFASIVVSGLTGKVEYTLLDSDLKPLKNGVNTAGQDLEVKYKARSAAKYYLKLTGSYSENIQPFSVCIPSDNNEWMWQMAYPELSTESKGTFDYYGDEDFFVLPDTVTSNIDKTALTFTKLDSTANVVVYDKDRNVLAQYIYEPNVTQKVSMYALKGAYALSVYAFDGRSSGKDYAFMLSYVDSQVLDIQTYGFALSPGYSDTEDYYTAQISTLTEKRITDIMTAVPFEAITVNVAQQCGYSYKAQVGEDLNLAPGRNIITIDFTLDGVTRSVTIALSHRAGEVYYTYKEDGSKVFVVDDKSKDNYTIIQKTNGKYEEIRNDKLFRYFETTMPASYRDKIEALRELHPEWKFRFVKTEWDFESFIDSQMKKEGSTPISTVNSKQATREQVTYCVDPRNFLNEKDIFMFENQLYSDGVYSNAGVLSIWNKGSSYAKDEPYASYIMEAGRSSGLSTYFVAARAALESGRGTSNLSKGFITGYRGYYNFYGIGAYNANPSNGAVTARDYNWNTKRKAIIEGATWIKENYIGTMQNTAYFMKFCFIPGREWHQYMTDIEAPQKDAASSYDAHAGGGTLSSPIEFIIPVFDNMP